MASSRSACTRTLRSPRVLGRLWWGDSLPPRLPWSKTTLHQPWPGRVNLRTRNPWSGQQSRRSGGKALKRRTRTILGSPANPRWEIPAVPRAFPSLTLFTIQI